MKNSIENVKTYLKYSHQVLGISHIFKASNKQADAENDLGKDAKAKKIFNIYFWPETKIWREFLLDRPAQERAPFQTLFVFFSADLEFETHMKSNTEMLAKMNQALGGKDFNLLIAWVSENAERDLFAALAQWSKPLKVVLFRDEILAKETMYSSGQHKILETLTPLANPADTDRKRFIWNDFKRWMASLSS
jgi:hypothetical protein